MSVQVLIAIGALCSSLASNEVLSCQKYYVTCVDKKLSVTGIVLEGDALKACILEKKYANPSR